MKRGSACLSSRASLRYPKGIKERSGKAINPTLRHFEERSNEAICARLLRFDPNDGVLPGVIAAGRRIGRAGTNGKKIQRCLGVQ